MRKASLQPKHLQWVYFFFEHFLEHCVSRALTKPRFQRLASPELATSFSIPDYSLFFIVITIVINYFIYYYYSEFFSQCLTFPARPGSLGSFSSSGSSWPATLCRDLHPPPGHLCNPLPRYHKRMWSEQKINYCMLSGHSSLSLETKDEPRKTSLHFWLLRTLKINPPISIARPSIAGGKWHRKKWEVREAEKLAWPLDPPTTSDWLKLITPRDSRLKTPLISLATFQIPNPGQTCLSHDSHQNLAWTLLWPAQFDHSPSWSWFVWHRSFLWMLPVY